MKKRSMARALAAMLMVGGLLTAVVATGGTAGAATPTYRYNWTTHCADSTLTVSFAIGGVLGLAGGGGDLSLVYRTPCNGETDFPALEQDKLHNRGRILTALGGTQIAIDVADDVEVAIDDLADAYAGGLPTLVQGNHIDYGWWSYWTGIFAFTGRATLQNGNTAALNTTWMGLNGAFYTNPGTFGQWGGNGTAVGGVTEALDALGFGGCGYSTYAGIDGGATASGFNTRWMSTSVAGCGVGGGTSELGGLLVGGISITYLGHVTNA